MTPEQEIKQKVKSMSREELQTAIIGGARYLNSVPCDTLRDIVESIEVIKWAEKNI